MSTVCIIGGPSDSMSEALLRLLEAEQIELVTEYKLHAPPEMPAHLVKLHRQRNTGPHRVHGKGKKAYRASL